MRSAEFTHARCGLHFPLRVEPTVFTMADMLLPDYQGGYWAMFGPGNGGFYMSPQSDRNFQVACENGFCSELSADALGLTACLYAYSNLPFMRIEACLRQYHLLRDYAMEHAEFGGILAARN
jgi:hypothetical protein